jgi:hypothetical protein
MKMDKMSMLEHNAEQGGNYLLQGAVMVWLEGVSLEMGLDELPVEQVQVVTPLPPSPLLPFCRDAYLLPLNLCVPHHRSHAQLLPSEAIRDGEQGGGPS